MSLQLGRAVRFPQPFNEDLRPPEPTPDWLTDLRVLLMALGEQLASLPVPQVTIEPQDLSDVVTAVLSLRPGATADEIGKAVARELAPAPPTSGGALSSDVVDRLAKTLEGIDWKLRSTQTFGGGPTNEGIERRLDTLITEGLGGGTGLTDTELRASDVGVLDTEVRDAVEDVALAVDGLEPLTDAQLRLTPVPVSGSVSVTEPVSVDDNGGSLTVDGTVSVSNFPATQPVSGTVTANLGTIDGAATEATLGTLALESGGNLAGAAASLAVMDDWDEADRAKVNVIAGQAGVDAGSGTVSAATQRVVLATDVALPAGTNSLGKTVAEASASGTGTSTFRDAALSNADVAVKASAGRVYGYNLFNPGSALAYVHFYDAATADVTVGTTTPKLSLALPSNANAQIGVDSGFDPPITFATAITVAASTTPGGGTAPGTAIVANVLYA